jgi:hypothetical protein
MRQFEELPNNNKKRPPKQKEKALENALVEKQFITTIPAERKRASIPSPTNTPGFINDGTL